MITGTVGSFLPRVLLDTALDAGADRVPLDDVPSLSALGDNQARLPTRDLLRMWELALPALDDVGGCLRVVEREHSAASASSTIW